MRITGGTWRGRKLQAPKGSKIRPTSDRVRESLFAILGGSFAGGDFLDLYAGTGAIGLEALSRGAKRAFLVDNCSQSLQLMKKNTQILGAEESALMIRGDIPQCFPWLLRHKPDVRVAFLDPPYALEDYRIVLSELLKQNIVLPGGLIAIEHFSKKVLEIHMEGIVQTDVRSYGDTGLTFYRVNHTV